MKMPYNLFRNTNYALAGIQDMLKNESSFRLEVIVFFLLQIALFFFNMPFIYSAVLRLSLFLPLIAEAGNSAIERTVDLVSPDYHELAKQAKDTGSAAVFFSILLTTLIWVTIFYHVYFSCK